MRILVASAAAVALLFATSLCAQNIAGDWQGTLHTAAQDLRLIIRIAPSGDGWKTTLFSIDQGTDWGIGIASDSVSLDRVHFQYSMKAIGGSFDGTLNDGNTITGTWTQRGNPLPLELRRATPETSWKDPASHTIRFIPVDKDVILEVLDWGGTGRPLVLLSGLGNTAHVFDRFAPKLTPQYHVYGITRRGYGLSSAPVSGYSADRLGDDVLAVVDALKLDRPILAGHSIAGEELSSVGSRHPERVAGLIYLEAGYPYAMYPAGGNLNLDLPGAVQQLQQLTANVFPEGPVAQIKELLETTLPKIEADLLKLQENFSSLPAAMQGPASFIPPAAAQAILTGEQKYSRIPVPILTIFASPDDTGKAFGTDTAAREKYEAHSRELTDMQTKAFESNVPPAHVVRIPDANHYVFLSNEADVLREMNAFISTLK